MSGEAPASPQLPAALLEAIYRHARATFPNECCGFVVGSGEHAQLIQCENFQDRYHAVDPEAYPRTAATAYTFGGKQLRLLADSFDTDAPATIVYHSHPRVGAYFSAEDTRAALSAGWPVDYLVVDCQDHEIGGAVLFRKSASSEQPQFIEIARFDGAQI
jgi:[CysO sulfur-carrier protein]-S-L-cysteine hydrolase